MIEEELINRFETFLPIVRSILYKNNNWPSKRLGKSFGLVLEPFEFLLENNLRQIKATAPLFANLAIIARQKGYSSAVVGLLLTALNIISLITRPSLGWLADRFQIHKIVFISVQAVTAISFFAVYFIPSFTSQVIINISNETTEIHFCPKDPIWDNCLDKRIQNHELKIIKCKLKCNFESLMQKNICIDYEDPNCILNSEPFEYEILLDVETIEKNSTCLFLKEFRNNSLISSNMYSDTRYFGDKLEQLKCDAICEDEFLKGTLANKGTIPDNEITQKYEFWLFALLLLLGYSSAVVVISMADTICFELLGEDTHMYGRQKMFDSAGSAIAAVVIGTSIDKLSGDSVFKDYRIVYFFCLGTIGLNIVFSMKLKFTQPDKSKNILKDVGKISKSLKAFTFFVWLCFSGIISGTIWNFLFWHLEELTDQIGQDKCEKNHIKTLEGLNLFVQTAIGEIPVLFWSGYILKKLGHINCMKLISAVFAIRCFYYSILSNPWWVLPIEVSNGVTYGLLMATMASYANLIALPGTEATIQGLVGAIFGGVGVSFGTSLAGILFDVIGGHNAFIVFGSIATTGCIAHAVVHLVFKSKFF